MIYYCYCSFGHGNTDLWPQDRCKMPAKLVALSADTASLRDVCGFRKEILPECFAFSFTGQTTGNIFRVK